MSVLIDILMPRLPHRLSDSADISLCIHAVLTVFVYELVLPIVTFTFFSSLKRLPIKKAFQVFNSLKGFAISIISSLSLRSIAIDQHKINNWRHNSCTGGLHYLIGKAFRPITLYVPVICHLCYCSLKSLLRLSTKWDMSRGFFQKIQIF